MRKQKRHGLFIIITTILSIPVLTLALLTQNFPQISIHLDGFPKITDEEYFVQNSIQEDSSIFATSQTGINQSCRWEVNGQPCGTTSESVLVRDYYPVHSDFDCKTKSTYTAQSSSVQQTTCSNSPGSKCYELSGKTNTCIASVTIPTTNACIRYARCSTTILGQSYQNVKQCQLVCKNLPTPTPSPSTTVSQLKIDKENNSTGSAGQYKVNFPDNYPRKTYRDSLLTAPTPKYATNNLPITDKRVLVIFINPIKSGKSMMSYSPTFTSLKNGRTDSQLIDSIAKEYSNYFFRLSAGKLRLSISNIYEERSLFGESSKFTFDSLAGCIKVVSAMDPLFSLCNEYRTQIMASPEMPKYYKFCEKAKEANADMIWFFAPNYFIPSESFLIGPTNTILGSKLYPSGPSHIVPGCDKHIPVITDPATAPFHTLPHGLAHYAEAIIHSMSDRWQKSDREKYHERFVRYESYSQYYAGTQVGRSGTTSRVSLAYPTCGNVHYPGNASYDKPYNFSIANINYNSECEKFRNFPSNTGNVRTINCSEWGCSDNGWQAYFMQHIPNNSGTTQLRSKTGKVIDVRNNWWFYIFSPDETLKLVEKSI